ANDRSDIDSTLYRSVSSYSRSCTAICASINSASGVIEVVVYGTVTTESPQPINSSHAPSSPSELDVRLRSTDRSAGSPDSSPDCSADRSAEELGDVVGLEEAPEGSAASDSVASVVLAAVVSFDGSSSKSSSASPEQAASVSAAAAPRAIPAPILAPAPVRGRGQWAGIGHLRRLVAAGAAGVLTLPAGHRFAMIGIDIVGLPSMVCPEQLFPSKTRSRSDARRGPLHGL